MTKKIKLIGKLSKNKTNTITVKFDSNDGLIGDHFTIGRRKNMQEKIIIKDNKFIRNITTNEEN